ncbi:transcription antitermination factor NusB [Mycoplasma zalophidermidis]|uniref:Transcription antitermination protein NusB n=1 Tax=Mycoplasma zalophidermidis TaxID=398174 RepID=A0ABS6DR33_9MOLU|nr:transcription antitermination factor NusB [Mycoplasma zalophidermidis]MBU4690042.1 transcription antitermination protein NusB [Mycoplasma zalophidermidis]MBU4693286.1 transcription antitermination protein NusB [Mycoplasma zalophidermidis]MCR8966418.1 transcription antitermination protein NusB [Mycoplasma zalophidermidis]
MKSRRINRIEIINALYSCELLGVYDLKNVFEHYDEFTTEQFKQVEKISLNREYLKKIIEKFLIEKSWDEESPLIRAILLNAAYEFFILGAKIVINEAVEITKDFFGEELELYKHVNKVLDSIYKFFVVNEALMRKYLK